MKVKFKVFAQISVFALAAASCTTNPDSPGSEYMPDMYRSPAIEPYVDYGEVRGHINENAATHLSAMVPPKYTIPFMGTDSAVVRMMLPYHRKPSIDYAITHGLFGADFSLNTGENSDYVQAAADVNRIKLTAEQAEGVFTRGKALYTSYCQHCHGEKGDGNGPMVTAGSFSGVPDYRTLTIAEGQMFYSIYYGKGAMGAHAPIANKEEIWTIVHYIRRFQDPNYGKFDAKGMPVTGAAAAGAPADTTAAATM